MTNKSDPETQVNADAALNVAAAPKQAGDAGQVDQWLTDLNGLLRELEVITAANYALPPVLGKPADNQLIQVRLGIASSLFAALQCKHAATAGHSLRVALTCSSWAEKMGLGESRRDAIEIAALLHDLGVIGAPDQILLKPRNLEEDEMALMLDARKNSLAILKHCCTSEEVLAIVENVPAWYDGSRKGFSHGGADIPLGARMIAIAEAFDAMTTDHVYRPARSHESAMAELFECAGTQFDPELVRLFAEYHRDNHTAWHQRTAQRWLHELDSELVNSYWSLNTVPSPLRGAKNEYSFETKLLKNMADAVTFIDAAGRIMFWNRGAERLTGIAADSICGQLWHPALLKMSDEKGESIDDADCPVKSVLKSGVQSLRRLTIVARMGRPIAVDTHVIPVTGDDGIMVGGILMFHDASSETTLERRCMNLYDKATKDPMTQVANRAEFDRVHEMFVEVHQQRQIPCSLIICDLDRFKQVNDTFGHQAGDEAIKCLAALLKSSCRPGDLVARYGGEEFVVLCTDCDNATAARRTEQIRLNLCHMPQLKMGSRQVTASFGVTEIQPGDTPETMLRRADRALFQAKAKGRNCVVQLGAGLPVKHKQKKSKPRRRAADANEQLLERKFVTAVPIKMAVEKLRGFVADHNAKINYVEGNHICLEIEEQRSNRLRRTADRPVTFMIDLFIEEERSEKNDNAHCETPLVRTKIRAVVMPQIARNRRRNDIIRKANELLASFCAYLMAGEEDPPSPERVWVRVRRILVPWLGKK
ncbi:MAG: diguanylate cyclase [Thermoguttaceae bacterium]|jgi:diguanylate cyclase (GGDEF)-like protein/PAS domain S-box-containing protein